jgi:hypothetical protein
VDSLFSTSRHHHIPKVPRTPVEVNSPRSKGLVLAGILTAVVASEKCAGWRVVIRGGR